jgi:HEAT repeat protein
LAALLLSRPAIAGEQGLAQSQDPDMEALHDAAVGTDPGGLIAYLHKCTPSDEQMRRVGGLVRRLGSRRFKEREAASTELRDAGFFACGVLRDALRDPDPEIARRARSSLGAYAGYGRWCWAPGAALRRLRALRARESLGVILRYLPYAPDEQTLEEAWYCLDEFGTKGGRVEPVLVAALQDRSPPRRAAAACIVGRRGDVGQRAAVRRLLGDPSPLVRLRAAQGLLAGGDKSGLEALTGLLRERAVDICWQAEELLHYAAGDGAPEATVGSATGGEREACYWAWTGWLNQHGANLDLGALSRTARRPGLLLAFEGTDPYPTGRVTLYGCDSLPRWRLREGSGVGDMQLLAGNCVLLAETNADRVVERALSGTVLWTYHSEAPQTCQRLANGNTFVGGYWRLVEVGADEARLYDLRVDQGSGLRAPQMLRAGRVIALVEDRPAPDIRRREPAPRLWPARWAMDEIETPSGRLHRHVKLPPGIDQYSGAAGLTDGHLLACAYGELGREAWKPLLAEMDADGKLLRACGVGGCGPPAPLRSGNTIVPCPDRVVEIDGRGRIQWEAFTAGAVARVRVCLPLVRFGFSRPPGIDLASSVSYRVRGLRDRRALVRARSAYGLGALGRRASAAVPELIELLADNDDAVVAAAGSAIQDIGLSAGPRLIGGLRDQRACVRGQCARLLHAMPRAAIGAVPALLRLLDDADASVRAAAAGALGPMAARAKGVLPALLRAGGDRAPEVRVAVVESIGGAGVAAVPAVPFLLRCLHGEDASLAEQAALALGRLGPIDQVIMRALMKALDDERICTAAARALGMMRTRRKAASQALIRALLHPPLKDTPVRLQCAAAFALGELGEPSRDTIAALVSVLRAGDADLRLCGPVATCLAGFGEKAAQALPSLVAIMRDSTMPDEVRIRAMECALAIRRPEPSTVAALKQAVEEGKGEYARRAAGALADIRTAAARHQAGR